MHNLHFIRNHIDSKYFIKLPVLENIKTNNIDNSKLSDIKDIQIFEHMMYKKHLEELKEFEADIDLYPDLSNYIEYNPFNKDHIKIIETVTTSINSNKRQEIWKYIYTMVQSIFSNNRTFVEATCEYDNNTIKNMSYCINIGIEFKNIIIENKSKHFSKSIGDKIVLIKIFPDYITFSLYHNEADILFLKKDYIHSHIHLNFYEDDYRISDMHTCLGSSTLNNVINDINIKYSTDNDLDTLKFNIDQMLIHLQWFLITESQAGVPYQYISKIFNNITIVKNTNLWKIVLELYELAPIFMKKLNINDEDIIFNLETFVRKNLQNMINENLNENLMKNNGSPTHFRDFLRTMLVNKDDNDLTLIDNSFNRESLENYQYQKAYIEENTSGLVKPYSNIVKLTFDKDNYQIDEKFVNVLIIIIKDLIKI